MIPGIEVVMNVDFEHFRARRSWEFQEAKAVLIAARLQAIASKRVPVPEDYTKERKIVCDDLMWLAEQLGLLIYGFDNGEEQKSIAVDARLNIDDVLGMAIKRGYVLPEALVQKVPSVGLPVEPQAPIQPPPAEYESSILRDEEYELNISGLSVENIEDPDLKSLGDEAYPAAKFYAALFAGILIGRYGREFSKSDLDLALMRAGFKGESKLKGEDFEKLWKAIPKMLKNSGRKANPEPALPDKAI